MYSKNNKKSTLINIKNKIKGIFFDEMDDEETNKKNKVVKSKRKFTVFETCFIGFILLFLGIIFGCLITMYTNSVLGFKISPKTFEFLKTYNEIKNNYYKKVDEKKLIDAGISGMIASLNDENSYYMDVDSTSDFNYSVDGKYVGIGVTIQYSDGITKIIDLFKDGPAEKAGLKKDDILIKVNNKNVENKDSTYISKLISGDVGKKVKLTVRRGEETLDYSLILDEIELQSVSSELKTFNNKNIGYIKIDNFAANTYKQFKNNLNSLEKKGFDSLIIDVRNNTGGHLSQATKVLDLFFKKDTVLFQIESKDKKEKYKAKTEEKRDYPVAILVNRGSASASELLTACFKENYKDVIVIGKTTYGKGTVQEAFNLSSGTSYKFTTQKWLTPKGNWINKKGIKPDIEIDLEENTETDLQLDTALKELTK